MLHARQLPGGVAAVLPVHNRALHITMPQQAWHE